MVAIVCNHLILTHKIPGIDNSGSRYEEHGEIFHKIFNRPTFRVKVVKDVAGVQLFGALKVLIS